MPRTQITTPGTVIRATRLNRFLSDGTAEFHQGGMAYICRRHRGRWYITADYSYL